MAEIDPENPFDLLAKIITPAANYEEARKLIWTAMKSGALPEEKVISILLTASTMPALAAANIQMEAMLKEHGLIPGAEAEEAPAKEPAPVNSNMLQFPKGRQVVN